MEKVSRELSSVHLCGPADFYLSSVGIWDSGTKNLNGKGKLLFQRLVYCFYTFHILPKGLLGFVCLCWYSGRQEISLFWLIFKLYSGIHRSRKYILKKRKFG